MVENVVFCPVNFLNAHGQVNPKFFTHLKNTISEKYSRYPKNTICIVC